MFAVRDDHHFGESLRDRQEIPAAEIDDIVDLEDVFLLEVVVLVENVFDEVGFDGDVGSLVESRARHEASSSLSARRRTAMLTA